MDVVMFVWRRKLLVQYNIDERIFLFKIYVRSTMQWHKYKRFQMHNIPIQNAHNKLSLQASNSGECIQTQTHSTEIRLVEIRC